MLRCSHRDSKEVVDLVRCCIVAMRALHVKIRSNVGVAHQPPADRFLQHRPCQDLETSRLRNQLFPATTSNVPQDEHRYASVFPVNGSRRRLLPSAGLKYKSLLGRPGSERNRIFIPTVPGCMSPWHCGHFIRLSLRDNITNCRLSGPE